jgi:hypothetical protein
LKETPHGLLKMDHKTNLHVNGLGLRNCHRLWDLKFDHWASREVNMISQCVRSGSLGCVTLQLTKYLCAVCFVWCWIASEGAAQSVFVLKLPDAPNSIGSQNQSIASISDEQLIVQDAALRHPRWSVCRLWIARSAKGDPMAHRESRGYENRYSSEWAD